MVVVKVVWNCFRKIKKVSFNQKLTEHNGGVRVAIVFDDHYHF